MNKPEICNVYLGVECRKLTPFSGIPTQSSRTQQMPTKEDSPSPSLYSGFGMKGEAALPRGGYSLVGSPVHLFGQLPVHLILFSAAADAVALASRVCLPRGPKRSRSDGGGLIPNWHFDLPPLST